MQRTTALVIVIVLFVATLGFHWVTYPAPRGRTICVLAKDSITFKDTFISTESQIGFTLIHPILGGNIMMGKAWCVTW